VTVKRVASVGVLAAVSFALFAVAGRTGSAETHRFVPQTYYNTYSAAHPPALRIRPGDPVSTKTVDAAGADADSKPVTAGAIRKPVRSTSRAPRLMTCLSSPS